MPLTIRHYSDELGADQGGVAFGDGVTIEWGAAAELDVLAALIARLQYLETISSDPDRVSAISSLQVAETDLTP